MDPGRPIRRVPREVSAEQARLWLDRLNEWAHAARALGYTGWARDFERQATGLRATIPPH